MDVPQGRTNMMPGKHALPLASLLVSLLAGAPLPVTAAPTNPVASLAAVTPEEDDDN